MFLLFGRKRKIEKKTPERERERRRRGKDLGVEFVEKQAVENDNRECLFIIARERVNL